MRLLLGMMMAAGLFLPLASSAMTVGEALGRDIAVIKFKGVDSADLKNFPLKVGDKLDAVNLTGALNEVFKSSDKSSNKGSDEPIVVVLVDFYQIKPDKKDPQKVDLTFFLYQVEVSKGWSNSSLPASAHIKGLFDTPGEFNYFDPEVQFGHDDKYGFYQNSSVNGYWNTKTEKFVTDSEPSSLHLFVQGRNSFQHDFYGAHAALDWVPNEKNAVTPDWTDTLQFSAAFDSSRDPLGSGTTQSTGGNLASSGQVNFDKSHPFDDKTPDFVLTDVNFALNLKGKAVETTQSSTTNTTDISGLGTAQVLFLLDQNPGDFTVWNRPGISTTGGQVYSDEVGRFSYVRVIPTGQAQYIRWDATVTGGGAVGSAPDYARFYFGNNLNNSQDVPSPVVRSFGAQAGGVMNAVGKNTGANSFVSLNSIMSFPIPGLSRPLIPHEADVNGDYIPDYLYDTAGRSLHIICDANTRQMDNGMKFVCYNADLYALKPVILTDAARLGAPNGYSDRTVAAVGGGIEATIVLVNFDLIYAHTVYDSSSQSLGGNIIFQMTYERRF